VAEGNTMAQAKKQEVVTQPEAMFPTEVPSYIDRNSARGSEEVTTKDLVLPRLEIVQSQSPIREAGAAEGTLFNSATMEQLGDLVYFVPVYFRGEYLIWKDQEAGGGFFGAFMSESEAEARKVEVVEMQGEDPNLLEIVDTPVHYGLLVSPSGAHAPQQIVISMPKSKAKVSRKWNAMIQIVGGDRFSRVYKITTFKDKNKKNQTFYNYVVQPAGYVPEPIFREAERTYAAFKQEGVRAAHETVINQDEADIDRSGI